MNQESATALAYAECQAHDKGIVHRDIKPANVLLDTNGQVVLADFGIVKIFDGTRTTLTTTGQIIGTPEFMSPEQAHGQEIGPSADIYSLGVLMFQLITNHVPFEATSLVDLLMQIIQSPAPSAQVLRPDLPAPAAAAIRAAMAKSPEYRLSSANALAQAFERGLSGLSSELPTEPGSGIVPGQTPLGESGWPIVNVEQPPRSGTISIAPSTTGLGIFLALLLILLAAIIFRGGLFRAASGNHVGNGVSSPTALATATPTNQLGGIGGNTPTPVPTPLPGQATPTPSASATATATPIPGATATFTPTPTDTPFATDTPVPTDTPTDTPVPTNTPLPSPPPFYGDGSDGPLMISYDTTDSPLNASCAGSAGSTSLYYYYASGLFDGLVEKPILIHQSQGSGAGTWMRNTIVSVSGSNINLASPLNANYTTGAQVIVLHEYTDVTINATWTAQPWNGSTGGILAFVASGTVTINGKVSADGAGFRGGLGGQATYAVTGGWGEDQTRPFVSDSRTNNDATNNPGTGTGGGGGAGNTGGSGGNHGGGGDGGNGTNGGSGVGSNVSGGGSGDLTNMVFGGGGGGGGASPGNPGCSGGNGGAGGGIIYIAGANLTVGNTVSANGAPGGAYTNGDNSGGGGGGAGGSILLTSQNLRLSGSMTVNGGGGGTGGAQGGPQRNGGNGGIGRTGLR